LTAATISSAFAVGIFFNTLRIARLLFFAGSERPDRSAADFFAIVDLESIESVVVVWVKERLRVRRLSNCQAPTNGKMPACWKPTPKQPGRRILFGWQSLRFIRRWRRAAIGIFFPLQALGKLFIRLALLVLFSLPFGEGGGAFAFSDGLLQT
jgi:hypothetical protein